MTLTGGTVVRGAYNGVNVESGKDPMLKAAGIRSARAFDRGAKAFELVCYRNSKVKIERWKPMAIPLGGKP